MFILCINKKKQGLEIACPKSWYYIDHILKEDPTANSFYQWRNDTCYWSFTSCLFQQISYRLLKSVQKYYPLFTATWSFLATH